MSNVNVDHAATNFRWAYRAWKDGEMKELALYLFRKAVVQLHMEGISDAGVLEACNSYMSPEVAKALAVYSEETNSDPLKYEAWAIKVRSLLLC